MSVENNSHLLWFCIATLRDWLKNSRYFAIQSQVKPKQIVARLNTFSRAPRQLLPLLGVLIGSMNVSASFVIGQSDDFGFGLTILRWNHSVDTIIQTTLFFQKTKQRTSRKKIKQNKQQQQQQNLHTKQCIQSQFVLILD